MIIGADGWRNCFFCLKPALARGTENEALIGFVSQRRVAISLVARGFAALPGTRFTNFWLHAVLSGQQPLDSFS
jgi:hypothetical protein